MGCLSFKRWMKAPYCLLLLPSLLLASCGLKPNECEIEGENLDESLVPFVTDLVEGIAQRDMEKVDSFVRVENLTFYNTPELEWAKNVWLLSWFDDVPESKRPDVVVTRIADLGVIVSKLLYKETPGKPEEVFEVSVKGFVDEKQFGIGLFVCRGDEGWETLIPNVFEVWRLDEDLEESNKPPEGTPDSAPQL